MYYIDRYIYILAAVPGTAQLLMNEHTCKKKSLLCESNLQIVFFLISKTEMTASVQDNKSKHTRG